MYHLCAFTGLVGQTVDTDIAFLQDDIITKQNSHAVLQQPKLLIGAAAMSATISRAKVASPTLRQTVNPYVRSIIGAAVPGNNANIFLPRNNPLHLPPFEELQMLFTSGLAMGTEQATGLLFLAESIEPWPAGDLYTVRFTSTTAAVANTWTTATLTWQDTLPPAVYALVYSECQSTNAQAHRWIVPNQILRPGHLSLTALTNRLPYETLKFPMMGRFRSNALPLLQVLVNGTDASHEGYAYCIRVGNLS